MEKDARVWHEPEFLNGWQNAGPIFTLPEGYVAATVEMNVREPLRLWASRLLRLQAPLARRRGIARIAPDGTV
jgi:hypothetical protein